MVVGERVLKDKGVGAELAGTETEYSFNNHRHFGMFLPSPLHYQSVDSIPRFCCFVTAAVQID